MRYLTPQEAAEVASWVYYPGEELEMSEIYTCPGCNATADTAAQMERHQAGCVLALRERIAELEAAAEANREHIARQFERNVDLRARIAELEAEKAR
jgi:protein-arginine kinase activator protein McsA